MYKLLDIDEQDDPKFPQFEGNLMVELSHLNHWIKSVQDLNEGILITRLSEEELRNYY